MSTKKCKRHGCNKKYTDEQNIQGACNYHPGAPIFHDLKKGWTCCKKIVYDWDEFQKLPTCATGLHTDDKQQAQGFMKSPTVANASNALQKQQAQKNIVIQDINKYNQDLQAKKKKQAEEKAAPGKQKTVFKTSEGKLRCVNQGCRKDYLQQQNNQNACHYHKGAPVFHDLKKFWTCCKKQTHDWDQFMKLPACCTGFHSPKYA